MKRVVLAALVSVGCSSVEAWIGDRAYTPIACDPGVADCDGSLSTGCETNVASDARHCGACDHACAAGQHCVASVCTP